MQKFSFLDDYSEGCHPRILEALSQTKASDLIRQKLGNPSAGIYFVASGTLANIIIIASCLRPHEAVVAAESGHIVVRETGAIEATGHKIISLPSPHMAKPRLVYISNTTELGTVYTKSELQALSQICKEKELLLFLDGARLGAALTAISSDLTLQDIAALVDIFWIGGTKTGALFGALLAKGRALGLQFLELFKDNLYFEAARHANAMAQKLSTGIVQQGHGLLAPTESNQVFPILPDTLIEKLQRSFDFYVWEKHNDKHSVVRLVTSWSTDESNVDNFLQAML